MLLASIWAPKTPPNWDPKGAHHQNMNIIDFAIIYYTLATSRGPKNDHFWCFFDTLFEMPFRDFFLINFRPFWGPSWAHFGGQEGADSFVVFVSLFGIDLGAFWARFWSIFGSNLEHFWLDSGACLCSCLRLGNHQMFLYPTKQIHLELFCILIS